MLYLYLVIGLLFVVNICASAYILKRDYLTRTQSRLQILFIWLIPFLGAIFFWQLNRSQNDISKPRKEFGGGARNTGYDTAGDGGGSD